MSIQDINALRDDLLIELAKRNATNGNPLNVMDLLEEIQPNTDWKANNELGRSAGWLLVKNSPPLAKTVLDSDKPGALLLAMTAAGKSEASRLFNASQPLTFKQKLTNVSRSDWIALGAFIVSIIALLK